MLFWYIISNSMACIFFFCKREAAYIRIRTKLSWPWSWLILFPLYYLPGSCCIVVYIFVNPRSVVHASIYIYISFSQACSCMDSILKILGRWAIPRAPYLPYLPYLPPSIATYQYFFDPKSGLTQEYLLNSAHDRPRSYDHTKKRVLTIAMTKAGPG